MDEKRKVVIIAGQLVVGGAERQLYLWLAHMDRDKFDPLVITLHPDHDDYWEKPIEDLGIPLFRVAQKPLRWMRLFDIFKIVRSIRPDLIHGWHLFPSPYAGIVANVINCHSLAGFRDSYNIFKKSGRIGRLAIRLTDAILVNSNTTAERLRRDYPQRSDRIFSVQNAVIDEFLDRMQAREQLIKDFHLDSQKTWIGSIGRLDPKKRFDLLMQAISKIEDESFQFILIGDGPEKQSLINLSISLGIADKVRFTGEIPNAASYLKGLDIFVFTSLDEGLPNVILEAGAAGLPIVTWNLPFYKEVLMQNGFMITAGDVQAFTSTLSNVLDNPLTLIDVGTKTRETILNAFNLTHYIDNLTTVYESLLRTSSPSSRFKL